MRTVAAGVPKGTMRKVVCLFDDETFDAIRERAAAAGSSFAEQVRTLVEWGLEAHEDDARMNSRPR